MTMRKLSTLLFGIAALIALLAPAAAQAAAPAFSIHSIAVPTNFKPGEESGRDFYEVIVTNKGGAPTNGDPIVITDTLPAGLTVLDVQLSLSSKENISPTPCSTEVSGEISTVTCTVSDAIPAGQVGDPDAEPPIPQIIGPIEPETVWPSEKIRMVVRVAVPPTASGTLVNVAEVEGGGAAPATVESENPVSLLPAPSGFQYFTSEVVGDDGLPVLAAGGRPYAYNTSFALNTELSREGAEYPISPAGGDVKDIEVKLPPGLVGNPNVTERCSAKDFNTISGAVSEYGGSLFLNNCPNGSVVGLIVVQQVEGEGGILPEPIYNLEPPKGMPAQLGFQLYGLPIYIDTALRSDGDYGITARLRNVSEAKRVTAATVTIWGTPGDPTHDRLRGTCLNQTAGQPFGPFSLGECPSGLSTVKPFFRLPTSCANPLETTMEFDTWASAGAMFGASSTEAPRVECAQVPFEPTLEVKPTTAAADSPSGLHVDLRIPQKEHEEPDERGAADLRDATVTLPNGLFVNPASANGLDSCTPAQIGLVTAPGQLPPRFNMAAAQCPNASKLGTVQVETPLLDHPIPGSVYLAKQSDNPFQSLIAIYLALEDPESGIVVKLAGKVVPDPVTGQISTTFTDNPQLPVESFELDFFEGDRASLRTPARCGTYATSSALTPWSAPASGPPANPSDSFEISSGPGGGCPSGALDPQLTGGLANPAAGAFSPFNLRITRADATEEISGLTTVAPQGLLGKLKGIPYCSEGGIAQAASRTQPGQGAAEVASPSCPDASQVGTAAAGAGAGPAPYYTAGKIYLAGPYKGAPFSFVAIVPAIAGPFDLGVVTDRIALRVNSETAVITAEADPLPRILSGIPLDIRDIRVSLDRPDFTLAPTSCEPKSLSATVFGVSGASATVSNRFQVGGCRDLPYRPKLSLQLKGGIKRNKYPALKAILTAKGGEANTAAVSVALPRSEFLEQGHIRTICTRVQFAADACPKAAIYGRARAFTPLLDEPLEGPVYLRSSNNPLPDMVAALDGQIEIDLVGRIDSPKGGGIRTTFDAAPDARVSKFVLEMQGGKKGLLVNSRNICRHVNRATVRMTGQNGKTHNFRPALKAKCKKSTGAGKKGKAGGKGR